VTGEVRQGAKAVLAGAGLDVVIGYGAFLVLALFVSLVGAGGFMGSKLTLADLLSGDVGEAALGGASAKGVLLVLLATATVGVPALWRNRLAPLAFAVPLVATAVAFRPLWAQQRAQQEALEGLGEFGLEAGRMIEQIGVPAGPLVALGIGAWLLAATVIFLALRGLYRVFSSRRPGVTSSSAS
jgi:hypothetical protein